MLTKLREPFGKAGLIVAIVALIAALGGGAYAASGGLTGKQKKEVTKIAQTEAKKFAGKNGTNGTNGTPGAAGAKGDAGAAGSNGTNGTNGAAGSSVEAFEIPPGASACAGVGGAEFEVEGSGEAAEICNGQPWTAGGTLPKGATETGSWAFYGSAATAREGEESVYVPISFPIPLKAPLGEANTVVVEPLNQGSGSTTPCKGTYTRPTAPVGTLCVYQAEPARHSEFGAVTNFEGEERTVDPAGGYLLFREVKDHAFEQGSYAVTGS